MKGMTGVFLERGRGFWGKGSGFFFWGERTGFWFFLVFFFFFICWLEYLGGGLGVKFVPLCVFLISLKMVWSPFLRAQRQYITR